MTTIDIKDISGQVRFSTPINKGAKGKFTLMKEDYIILPFSVPSPIPFKLGDYVDLAGVLDESLGGKLAKIYEITDLQKPTYNSSTGGYDYELQMNAYYWKWKNKIFKYTPEQAGSEASWSLTAALDVQLGVFLRNLKALGYTYRGTDFTFSIDDTVENKAVAMTYDNMNLLDALFSMAGEDKWNCDCWITDNVIHFGRNEFGDAVKIERGVEASSITRSESQGIYATRIYAFGSTKNIPTNYRPTDEQAVINGVVQKRLMLPADTPYIDAYEGMSQEEAIEDVVVFDDVYPRRIGTLSDVHTRTEEVENEDGTTETVTYYRYKDTGLEFKEEYIIEGQELQITFQSGKLNGMVFGVIFNPTPKDETRGEQLWEIVRNENYGRPLPDDIICPENGNQYILSGFDIQLVSDQYIPAAEQELKEKALKYAEIAKKDDGTYPTTLMSDWVHEDPISRTFEFGQRINLVDDTYFENGRISRVLGWEMNLDIPWDSPVYTIGESMPYSRIGEIEDKVDALTYKGQTYTGSGGSLGYVIKTNDSTSPSDSNVFSALRSMAEFLSKTRPDVAKGIITFIKGGKFGSDEKGKPIFIINNEIKTSNFSEGDLGSGLVIKTLENGNSYIEVDELFVRKLAYFVELVIKRLTHVGGEIILSPASMTCSRVDEFEEFYRCYFNQDDGGRSIVQEFAVNDQARSQTFNIKEGTSYNVSNQYYWRLVVGIGENYIDLSKVDCDRGSTVPQAGDYIVQLGNRSDVSRQNAQILSSYGSDAPSYKQYKGIDSYSLEGKEMAKISHSGNRIVGDFILTTGQDVSTQFKVLENLITSEISSVRKEIAERDNILSNAAFSEDTLKWQTSQSYTPYTIDGKYLFFFGKPYVWKKEVAGIATVDGKNSLRIKNSSVLQLNEDFAYHPNFEEIKKLSTDEEGNPMFDEQGNPIYIIVKEARMFTIEFYYKCVESGTLSISFDGVDKTGFEDFNAVEENVVLPSNTTYENYAITGMWNGTGDLRISFTGDIYIQSILLTEDRFADIEYRYSTKFEQMDKLISMNASEIKKTNTSLEEKYAELKITADGISATVSSNYEDLSGNINELSSTVSMNHSTLILEIGRVERLVDERYDDARYWANYYLEVTSNELRSEFTTGINDLETGYSALKQTVNGLSSTVASNKADADKSIEAMNAALSGVKSDVASVNGTLSTVQENLSSIGIRLGNVESNYVTTTVFNQTKDMVVAQANKWDNLGALVSQAGFILTSEAASLYVAQGNVISAINLEPGNIKIKSDKINLEGSTLFSTSTDRYSSVWIEGSRITLYSPSGTSRYVSLNASSSSPELLMYNGSDVSRLNPYQLYIVRGLYGTTFGAYSNGKIDLRADSWPTASSQVSVNGVYVEGNTLKVRTS